MGTRQEAVQGQREIFSVEGPPLRQTWPGHVCRFLSQWMTGQGSQRQSGEVTLVLPGVQGVRQEIAVQ